MSGVERGNYYDPWKSAVLKEADKIIEQANKHSRNPRRLSSLLELSEKLPDQLAETTGRLPYVGKLGEPQRRFWTVVGVIYVASVAAAIFTV